MYKPVDIAKMTGCRQIYYPSEAEGLIQTTAPDGDSIFIYFFSTPNASQSIGKICINWVVEHIPW